MEHAQREVTGDIAHTTASCSLNPYFNGTCSKRLVQFCCTFALFFCVLILILMEHAQRVYKMAPSVVTIGLGVLILILMEHAQREHFL